MRNRRVSGAVVLIVALVSLFVGSKLQGPPVAGQAVAVPVPGPPRVGDCVLQRTPDTVELGVDGVPALSVATGSCAGPHFGEVFELIPISPKVGSLTPPDPCFDGSTIQNFFGLTPIPAGGPWNAAISFSTFSAGPDTRQRAAGQRWTACLIVVPVDLGTAARPAMFRAPYLGSARHSAGSGLPGAFATCTDDPDPTDNDTIDCSQPHRYQILAIADTGKPGLTQQYLDTSCRTAAAEITGMADVTAGGALAVTAEAFSYGQFGDRIPGLKTAAVNADGQWAVSGEAFCSLQSASTRKLAGSLVGLGRAPIPWA